VAANLTAEADLARVDAVFGHQCGQRVARQSGRWWHSPPPPPPPPPVVIALSGHRPAARLAIGRAAVRLGGAVMMELHGATHLVAAIDPAGIVRRRSFAYFLSLVRQVPIERPSWVLNSAAAGAWAPPADHLV